MEVQTDCRLSELSVRGTPHERGRTLGEALRREIHQLLYELRSRCAISNLSGYPSAVANLLWESAQIVRAKLPDIALEVEGLALGADISNNDAWLLQLWREAQACTDLRGAGECSLFAATWRGAPLLAQTVDLQPFMARYEAVVRIASHNGSPEILMFTFAGLLGYLGVNSAGIAVGINMVASDGWRAGIPPYLLVRHLLTQHTLRDVEREIERLPRASSRCLTVADAQRAIQIEFTMDASRNLSSPHLLHTNHYVHPDLVESERSHILLRRNSRQRLNVLITLVPRLYPAESRADSLSTQDEAERAFSILAHHGDAASICCHGRPDQRAIQTVAAVIMFPAQGELFLKPGLPCTATTQTHRLGGANA
jgi:isopenicillin-N N-acyltransferase like protein